MNLFKQPYNVNSNVVSAMPQNAPSFNEISALKLLVVSQMSEYHQLFPSLINNQKVKTKTPVLSCLRLQINIQISSKSISMEWVRPWKQQFESEVTGERGRLRSSKVKRIGSSAGHIVSQARFRCKRGSFKLYKARAASQLAVWQVQLRVELGPPNTECKRKGR